MKVSLQFLKLCCITAVMALPAWMKAQSKDLPPSQAPNMTLSMHFKKTTIQNLLSDLGKQTGLSVHYDKNTINGKRLITFDCTGLPVNDALAEISNKTGLHFTVINDNLVVSAEVSADQTAIRGTVKDSTGAALIGVSVGVKGTSRGIQTGADGSFSLNARAGEVLVFSYIGYQTKEVTVGSETTINVVLSASARSLSEVVVTALGIRRESKSLTYGVQTVSGADINKVPDPSLVNSLSGRVAGAQITRSSSGVGGSTKIVLRGNKSINGDNNALYVIDGIPMPRNISGQAPNTFGGQDRGDAIENLNPDDVESITILPGSASAALYGSQGANGVVLITTKKGLTGKTQINFSSNTTFDKPFITPKFQTTYGQTTKDDNGNAVTNSPFSWGSKLSSPSTFDPSTFFNTGKTFINSLSVQTGTQHNQSYFSFQSTNSTGIIPNNKLDKYNFTVRNSSQFLNDKLTLDVSADYVSQLVNNRPFQGFYYNPLVSLYTFPRGVNFNQYKTNYEVYDPVRNLMSQNWPYASNDIATQNPYWIANRNNNQDRLSRILGTVSLKYTLTDWLNIQGRLKVDRTNETYEAERFATSNNALVGPKGSYQYNPTAVTQTYADVIANINKSLSKKFSLTANIGASLQNNQTQGSNIDGNLLNFTNVFSITNIDYSRVYPTQYGDRRQIQSVFATASLGYNDMIYLDVTGRNDWDSSLAFTSKDNFFYPAVGLNAVLSKMFKLPETISFAKLRANLTNVGNGSSILYATNPTYPVVNGSVNAIGAAPFTNLKPEKTRSYEIGLDSRLFNDKLSLTVNLYKSYSKNQIYQISVSPSTGYSSYFFNGGNLMNKGLEVTLGYNAKFGDFTWRPSGNFSLNRNRVLDVLEYTDPYTNAATTLQYVNLSSDVINLRVQKGGSFGDLYANAAQKDANGNYITDANGAPIRSSDYTKIGNYNPNFLAGLQNEFGYKNFRLSFLIDGRFGGEVISVTQGVLDQYGVSQASGQARDNGGVLVNGKLVNAKYYYDHVSGRSPIPSEYVYSATNIRLREVVFGYTLPGTYFNNKIKNIGLSVIGRNLWMIKNNAPFDPDVALSTANNLQGLDVFNLPSLRSIGFKISAQF